MTPKRVVLLTYTIFSQASCRVKMYISDFSLSILVSSLWLEAATRRISFLPKVMRVEDPYRNEAAGE